MFRLTMDRESKQYRVVVVAHSEAPEAGNEVHVYHSRTGQWVKADCHSSTEVVYGYLYDLTTLWSNTGPSPYIFENGQLLKVINTTDLESEAGANIVHDYLLVKNCFMFWMRKEAFGAQKLGIWVCYPSTGFWSTEWSIHVELHGRPVWKSVNSATLKEVAGSTNSPNFMIALICNFRCARIWQCCMFQSITSAADVVASYRKLDRHYETSQWVHIISHKLQLVIAVL